MRCSLTSFSLLEPFFNFTPNTHETNYPTSHPRLLARYRPILMYDLRHRKCSTSFVASGTNLFMRHRSKRRRRIVQLLTHQQSPQISLDIFRRSTSRYMKAQIGPYSLLPMGMVPSSHLLHRILCVMFKITTISLPKLHIWPLGICRPHLLHVRAFQSHWIPFLQILFLAQQKMPRKPPMSHHRA